ncbi:MAG: ABC transporter ATP-binding protein [Oscillospiraceae bacterium]|jgi:putative ABC transport system ATP-binding protein|nr:ABC transporter ATP-binding protein [Oscillospiraceae bacterium]
MVSLANITKIYNDGTRRELRVLDGLDLELGSGESVAVMGRSGSGKTTLMNIIGLLDTPSSGTYSLDGKNCADMSESRQAATRCRFVGMLLQDFALIEHDTALNNVMLPLFFSRSSFREMKKTALRAMDRVGVEHLSSQRVATLSGGEKQRVALARALVVSPKLLVADEPTGALDYATGVQIMGLLREINDQGVTLILVTHDSTVASACKKVVTLKDGKLYDYKDS